MIEHFYYLMALLVSISGMLVIDYRYRLAFWYDPVRTWWTVLATMAVFIVWDTIGIATRIFFKGDSTYMLPFTLAPEFPVEELFFLFLLSYVTLVIYRGACVWRRIS